MRLTLVMIFLVTACFSEEVDWQPPTTIGTKNGTTNIQVASNDAGLAAATWVNADTPNHVVASIFDLSTGTWGTPEVFSVGVMDAGNPDISVDQDGNIVVVWDQDGVMYAADYNGTTWSTSTVISSAAGFFQNISVSAYGDGNAVAIWRRSGAPAPTTDIMVNYFSGGVWSGEESLQTSAFVQAPTIDINNNGFGVAIWYTSFIVLARTFDNGVWTPPLAMAPTSVSMNTGGGGDEARNPDVAVNDSGIAVAVWNLDLGATNVVQSSTLVGGSWSAPINASIAYIGGTNSPRIGIDDDGNVIGTWAQQPGITGIVANALPFGGTWPLPATLLSSSGSSPDIAVNGSGDAVVVFAQSFMGGVTVFGSTFTFGDSAWSTNEAISPLAGSFNFFPQIAIDEVGNPFAVWNQTGPDLAGATYGFGIPDAPGLSGVQVVHRFPTQSDYINVLTMQEGHQGGFFRIFRDSTDNMIGETRFYKYEDHQRIPGATTTYYVTQVFPTGQESAPTGITVP